MNNELYQMRKDKWDRLAVTWVDAGSPASPSREDVTNYQTLLNEVLPTESKVLILGCTPSLRVMLGELRKIKNIDVVCVDFSVAMYKRTSELVNSLNINDKLVISDWLTMDLEGDKFNVILGDKVIDNIMPDDWPTFFERIHNSLQPQGYFITRLAPQNMALKETTFSSSLFRWAKLYEEKKETLERVVSGFWEELLGASAFKGETRYYTQKIDRFADEVEEIQKRINLLNQSQQAMFEEFLRVFWDKSKSDQWSSYDFTQIVDLMKFYFIHEKSLYSSDYKVASRQPVIRMRSL